jgi:inner membrane transporter RhtA
MSPAPVTAPSSATAPRGSRGAVTAPGKPRRLPGPAILLVLGSCSSLQVGAALALRLFPVLGAPGAAFLRLGLAAVVLLAVTRPRVRGWRRTQWRAVLLYGVSLAGTNAFFYAALARLPLGTAVTIQFLGPLTLSAALSRRMRDLGWVLLAVTGVAILGLAQSHGPATAGSLNLAGVAFALVSAAFWALYIVTGARASAAVPGRGGLAVAMTVGALVLVPFGARGAAHITGQPHLIPLTIGMAVLASVVPYSLELAAMRRAPKRVFGILLSLEPAVATTAGWLLLGQHAAPAALAAVVIVVAASTGSALGAGKPESPGLALLQPGARLQPGRQGGRVPQRGRRAACQPGGERVHGAEQPRGAVAHPGQRLFRSHDIARVPRRDQGGGIRVGARGPPRGRGSRR